jgi:hypothetical protein
MRDALSYLLDWFWFIKVSHVALLASFWAFAMILFSNPVSMTDSFSIAMWSWPSYKRDVLGPIWDIGQVSSRKFNGIPFNPLEALSGPSIGIKASLVTS